jgi:hypothetical protein
MPDRQPDPLTRQAEDAAAAELDAAMRALNPDLYGLAVENTLARLRGAGEGLRLALLEANARLISSKAADADQQRSVTLALSAWKEAIGG